MNTAKKLIQIRYTGHEKQVCYEEFYVFSSTSHFSIYFFISGKSWNNN